MKLVTILEVVFIIKWIILIFLFYNSSCDGNCSNLATCNLKTCAEFIYDANALANGKEIILAYVNCGWDTNIFVSSIILVIWLSIGLIFKIVKMETKSTFEKIINAYRRFIILAFALNFGITIYSQTEDCLEGYYTAKKSLIYFWIALLNFFIAIINILYGCYKCCLKTADRIVSGGKQEGILILTIGSERSLYT